MQDNDRNGAAAASDLAAKAEERVRMLGEAAKSRAGGRVRNLQEKARERAGSYAGIAQERLDGQRDHVASNIESAASRLRERADATGPMGHKAGEQVATRMEAAAGYLHGHDTNEIAGDVATYVKQHPIQSVIIALVLGYLWGKLFG